MRRPVLFEHEADEEFRFAAAWYEERRVGLGNEFIDAVDSLLKQVLRFPQIGALVPRVPPDLRIRRAPLKRFPYHVVYLEDGDAIRVLAVSHDRRRPGYWKPRP